jgi:hypothetical protein
MESAENSGALKNDIYARVDHRFATVRAALSNPDHWCEVLLLHPNVAQCRTLEGEPRLGVHIGRRLDQRVEEAYYVEFAFKVKQDTDGLFAVVLDAPKGPMGTGNYRIEFEALPVEDERTFIHLLYSYSAGLTARLATSAYLSTKGRDKVGFSVVGKGPDGKPLYVGGMRGAIERNAMRYYLAIDSFVGAFGTPPPNRFERSLQLFAQGMNHYARQLKEDDPDKYLAVKRGAYRLMISAR